MSGICFVYIRKEKIIKTNLLILAAEALVVYFLVLFTHSLRKRFGLTFFYALLGGLTVTMSWITDAGVAINIYGITFMIGSTVFYTSLLLGVFVLYVFEGPTATRVAIFTIAGMSILTPLIAALIHFQTNLAGLEQFSAIPMPTLRINSASVLTTIVDLIFLALMWEILGKAQYNLKLWKRAFFTLLGVMWLDVLLFATGAFAGTPHYFSIIQGTLISRFFISIFAFPILYFYLSWQKKLSGTKLQNRPILSILKDEADIRTELNFAKQEIKLRIEAEVKNEALIKELKDALNKVEKLEDLVPICASCRKVRIEPQTPGEKTTWISMENYIVKKTTVELSHSICPECAKVMYPEIAEEIE